MGRAGGSRATNPNVRSSSTQSCTDGCRTVERVGRRRHFAAAHPYEARESESAAARVFRSAVRSGSHGALLRVSSRFEDHPQGIRIRDEESGRTLKCAVAVVVSNSNPGMTLFPTLSTERQRPEKVSSARLGRNGTGTGVGEGVGGTRPIIGHFAGVYADATPSRWHGAALRAGLTIFSARTTPGVAGRRAARTHGVV